MGLAATNVSADAAADLISGCEDCHGKAGASKEAEIPIIGGLSAVYITDSFAAYGDKARPCEEVKHISGPHKGEVGDMCKSAEELSTEEVQQVADHFAAEPFVPAIQTFDAGLAVTGKSIHDLNCKKCHEPTAVMQPDDDAGIGSTTDALPEPSSSRVCPGPSLKSRPLNNTRSSRMHSSPAPSSSMALSVVVLSMFDGYRD